MATSPEEMEDVAKIPGGLLTNFGTLTSLEGMIVTDMGMLFSKVYKGSVAKRESKQKTCRFFDPVGVGATSFRKRTATGALLLQLTLYFKLTPLSRALDCVASHGDQGERRGDRRPR